MSINVGRALKSLAEPAMLLWCRTTARQSVAAAAKAAKVTEEKIAQWESGVQSPTFNQLSLLANLYKRPTCTFYLQSPPTDFSVMRDFRTLNSEQKEGEFSPKLAIAIRQAKERSLWLSEFLESSGEPELDFVAKGSLRSSPASIGKMLRALLNVTIEEQSQCANSGKALAMWRERCENLGVCVFSVSRVETDEMRGFAIIDRRAPVVAFNVKDSPAARIFTLMHEMAHVLIGEEGISDLDFGANNVRRTNPTETFCNAVAAEALVPESLIKKMFDAFKGGSIDAIEKLALKFRVSQEVIARRLLDLEKVPRSVYRHVRAICTRRALEEAQRKAEKPKKKVIIPQFQMTRGRVGTRFSKAAITAFRNGQIDGSSLSDLLGMKLSHLGKLESSLFSIHVIRGNGSES